tara:strand:+ start:8918 stop:10297 length:1380 start_codon:yes stop_codon:yes gene_type:complete
MSDLKNFKLAIFVRDQKYYEQILKYLEKSTKEIDNLSITFIADHELKTNYNFINTDIYTRKIDVKISEKDFYLTLNNDIWKNKKVYKADPRYISKEKKITWHDQYKLYETCKVIFEEEQFDLVFMGAAAYLNWIVPHLVALEMNILSYKLSFYDYINPYFEGVRVWFCPDPFWDLRVNSRFDFKWEKNEVQKHINSLRKSLIEDNFNLDQNALTLRENYTPKKFKNIIKNIVKLLVRSDHLSKIRLRAFIESKKNSKIYTEIKNLPNKFLLFPLNMPYDEQLTLRAPGFENNNKSIKYILENIPSDCGLVIKEHPVNPGMMNYKDLLKFKNQYSNFFVISPSIPLRDVLFHSKGLLTINSTAGLESLMVNKNVLALGMGYYKDLESVYTIDSKPIKEILNEISSGQNIVQSNEIDDLLERILNQTHPAPNLYPDKILDIDIAMNDALCFKINQIIKFRD